MGNITNKQIKCDIYTSNYVKTNKEKIISMFDSKHLPKEVYNIYNNDVLPIDQNIDLTIKKYDIIKPYILYVGNAYPHKNLEALVLSYGEIKDKNLQLVLVGKEDFFYKKIKDLAKEKNIIFTDFVPDGELDAIYKNSLFYIFPSLYEGFGLPPIEAMKRSVPVASSDHPCMREILGENAYFFEAGKKENITKAIMEFSADEKLREKLAAKGHEWAGKYNWKKMAEETLSEYKILNKKE